MSREYSFFPLSTPKMFTFPTWVPVARYWESGEKAKVQASTAQEEDRKDGTFAEQLKTLVGAQDGAGPWETSGGSLGGAHTLRDARKAAGTLRCHTACSTSQPTEILSPRPRFIGAGAQDLAAPRT